MLIADARDHRMATIAMSVTSPARSSSGLRTSGRPTVLLVHLTAGHNALRGLGPDQKLSETAKLIELPDDEPDEAR